MTTDFILYADGGVIKFLTLIIDFAISLILFM